jgi:hypothetical protein
LVSLDVWGVDSFFMQEVPMVNDLELGGEKMKGRSGSGL